MLSKIITAGDTFLYTLTSSVYPASDYTAILSIAGSVNTINIDSTDDGTTWTFTETADNTANWLEGLNDYVIAVISKTGSPQTQFSIETGQTTIELRADLAPPSDKRSHFQIVLDNIEAVIENRATKDQQSYSIGSRSLTLMSIDELLKLRSYYKDRINEINRKGKIKQTRFVLP